MQFKNIAIFKNKAWQEGSRVPKYHMQASIKDGEQWVNRTVAGLWVPDQAGDNMPVMKGSLRDSFEKDGKSYPGFVITEEGQGLDALPDSANQPDFDANDVPF